MNIHRVYQIFPTETDCLKYLEKLRWPTGPVCPYCNEKVTYRYPDGKRLYCYDCSRAFSVTVRTIFHKTRLPLQKWFAAVSIVLNAKRGHPARQLARDIGVTKDTAWYMAMRIREAMGQDKIMLEGLVQADECVIGGANKNRHMDKKVRGVQGRGAFKDPNKFGVIAVRNPKGHIIARYATDTKKRTLNRFIRATVAPGTELHTDEWKGYRGLHVDYEHFTIDHRKYEYCVDGVTTNSVENFWSIVQRGITGNFYHISRKWAPKYIDEFVYKQNYKNDLFDFTMNRAVRCRN